MRRLIDTASTHLPPRLAGWVQWCFSRWPGRMLTASATGFVRIELFDRSMTIAAQIFTSVFPILLMASTWLRRDDGAEVGRAVGLPEETQTVLDQALANQQSATFGLFGALFVLASATSLSRALTRAYSAIWLLPRPTLRINVAWRWLAALLALAVAMVATFSLTRQMTDPPPRGLLAFFLTFVLDLTMGIFIPWVLLARQVEPRRLLPGAVILAAVLLVVRPGVKAWLPLALDASANRYGSIGVAFTYLACLYVLSFCWLACAVVGQVVADDDGPLGRWIRGGRVAPAHADGEGGLT